MSAVTLQDHVPEPGIIALMGEEKEGKTVEMVATWPTAMWAAAPGKLDTARRELGIDPYVTHDLKNLDLLNAAFDSWCSQDSFCQAYSGIGTDDASILMANSIPAWRAENTKNMYHAYNRLDDGMARLRLTVGYSGLYAPMSFHETGPKIVKGIVERKGYARVPSVGQDMTMTSAAKAVYRVVPDPSSLDPWWKRAINGNPDDPEWRTGDGYGVLTRLDPSGPMNLRELLRASNPPVVLPRWPGLEWQDGWADAVARELDNGATMQAVANWVGGELAWLDWRHVRWAIRDGIARHVYRQRRRSWLDVFAVPAIGSAPAGAPPKGAPPASDSSEA